VAQIAASIREWGWTSPVLVDEQSNIIAGHCRVLAAQRLGLPEVPVMVARGWSEAQKQAYVIADNKLALNAGWDEDLLRIELGELRGLGADLGLTGFGELELDALFANANDGKTDPDDAPEIPVNPVSRPGDLWTCGEHRVLCGDATVLADVEKVLGGELADVCFTDPPYGVNYANSPKDKQRGKHRLILNDRPGEDFEAMLHAASTNVLAVTKGAIYMCMSSSELDTLQRAFRAAGGRWSTFVIWAKHTFTLGRADYQRQYEPILYGWKEGANHFWCGARDQGDVWFFDKPSRNDLHPTMKPVALVERAIRNSSKSRDIVLDPFGGSGTTMIAAERLGRRARLAELDPKYVDVAVQRWQTLAGSEAILEETGETYAEITARRHLAMRSNAERAEQGVRK
jgi:DNA modification methylase